MKQKHNIKELLNAESEEGYWDLFHHERDKLIRLVQWTDTSKAGQLTFTYEEWDDLVKLIKRVS